MCNNNSFYRTFQASVSSQKMINMDYHTDFLIPNRYSYKEENISGQNISEFLHLEAGGNILASFPFHFRFSPMNYSLLLYTESGAGKLTYTNGRECTVSDGQLVFHDCIHPFSLRSIVLPWNFKLFFISGRALATFSALLPSYERSCFTLSSVSPVLHSIRTLFSVSSQPGLGEILLMHKNLTDILSLLGISCCPSSPAASSVPWYLTEMKDFIDHHLAQSFSLDMFENRFQINRYRLCREFSSEFGAPPLQYLTRKRLDEAKKILLTTDLSIHEVSSIVGYENANHFINLFKKYENTTPGQFRQKALKSQSVSHCPSQQTSRTT